MKPHLPALLFLLWAPASPAAELRENVELAIRHLEETLPSYSRGKEFLAKLQAAKSEEEIRALQYAALVEASGLKAMPLLVVRRDPQQLGLPQNWQGNCALPPRGYSNEISLLRDGRMKTLFRPVNGEYVGDVDLHFSAARLLFTMPNAAKDWRIWEMKADGSGLRQLTPDENEADHYDACYLPDDSVIFSSTAVFAGVPCVGGGNRVANLFRMDAAGKNIRRLCYDQEHNWNPAVMNDGRVMYTRWEYTDTPHYFTRLLFRMNPDGTGQAEHYGSNSYWPNSIFYARPIPGHPTRFVAIVSGHHGVARMGELVLFDPAQGRREADGAVQRIPGRGGPVAPTIKDALVNSSWPRFLHPFPLDDKRFLVSCQPSADKPWGIYLADVFDNLVPLYEEPGMAVLEPVPLRPTPRPPVIPDRIQPDTQEATVYLTDIYDGPGLKGVPRGSVKRLRVYSYHYAYPKMGGHIHIGVDGPWDPRRILGTVPVAADGSAVFKVPANTPLALQPLDEHGQAIQIMRSWFTAMPGETVSCMGCHESQNAGPATRPLLAAARAPTAIEPWLGPERPFSFVREVQPVLDRHCVGCHDGKNPATPNFSPDQPRQMAGGKNPASLKFPPDQPRQMARSKNPASPNFSPDQPRRKAGGPGSFNGAYLALHPFVRRPGPESDYHLPNPYEYHASTSELVRLLRGGHHNVQLDPDSWARLITWIDLNVPDHGTWGEHRPVPGDYARLRREADIRYGGRGVDPEAYPEPPPPRQAFVPPPAQVAGPARSVRAQPPAQKEWPLRQTLQSGSGPKIAMILVPDRMPCYLASREVTNAEFALFAPDHDSGYVQIFNKDATRRGIPANQPEQPVVRVTWLQAAAYCKWLSEKTGRNIHLPSEEQWEAACRAGTQTPLWYGGVETDFSTFENLADASLLSLAPRDSPPWLPVVADARDGSVGPAMPGRYKPNPMGFHDMHGNVAEWTSGEEKGFRISRGGSFWDRPVRATAAERRLYLPHQSVFDVGFRLCWTPGPNDLPKP